MYKKMSCFQEFLPGSKQKHWSNWFKVNPALVDFRYLCGGLTKQPKGNLKNFALLRAKTHYF